MTPSDYIDTAVQAGRDIDVRFAGLRQSNPSAWMDKVVWLAHIRQPDIKIGRKARSPGARVSPDTVGFFVNNDSFYAVSIIRDNPPTNEWRDSPLDYGIINGQSWFPPVVVDVGEENPPNPPTNNLEARVSRLEHWARNIGFK